MLPKLHPKIKQLVLCWITYKLQLKHFQTFKAYRCFSNYQISTTSLKGKFYIVKKYAQTCEHTKPNVQSIDYGFGT